MKANHLIRLVKNSCLLILFFFIAGSQVFSQNLLEDAYVRGADYATKNFGTVNYLGVRYPTDDYGDYYKSFIKFDISTLTHQLETATLKLYVVKAQKYTSDNPSIKVYICPVTQNAWYQNTITWNSSQAYTIGAKLDSVNIVATTGTVVAFNISSYVNQQIALGQQFVSFVLLPEADITKSYLTEFASKENTSHPIPTMEVTEIKTKLSGSSNNLLVDDLLVKQQVAYKTPGTSGLNLTWDFSAIQITNPQYTVHYFNPDSSKPNQICGQENDTRYYSLQKNDSLWTTGHENANSDVEYTTPELRMRFPFVYGDVLNTTFVGTAKYGHKLSLPVNGYTQVKADATGTLKLPNNEVVDNALRVRTTEHYTQTANTEIILDTYSWYANGMRYPVFESIQTLLRKAGTDNILYSTSFYYYQDVMRSAQIDQTETALDTTKKADSTATKISDICTEVKLIPNPVVDNLTVNFKLSRNATIAFTLYSSTGAPVYNAPSLYMKEGYQSANINMSALPTGVYTLNIKVDGMVMTENVMKR